jgi:hypothetical protein
MSLPVAPAQAPGEVALLVLADIAASSRLWGWSRFVLGKWPLRGVPGLSFIKVLGSGFEGGFGLRPSGSRQGLFLLFDTEAAAQSFADTSPLLKSYRRHAREFCMALLRPCSCRGSWSGRSLKVSAPPVTQGAVGVLTRASIKPGKALEFWSHAPPSEVALDAAPGCRIAVGLGEAPLLRQATFSIWDNVEVMQDYARGPAHGAAARAAFSRDFFTETMFVRFVPLWLHGTWKGEVHA